MRIGLEREIAGVGEIKLSSLRASGNLLEPGALIPTRSPLNAATTKATAKFEHLFWTGRDFFADHPAVGIVTVIMLVFTAVCLVRRLLVRTVCLVFLICLAFYGTSHKARGQELGYSRQALISEQKYYEQRLKKAHDQINIGKERLGSGLTGLVEAPVLRSLMILDALETQMSGHEDRIRALRRAALAYNRDQEIARLLGTAREQETRRTRLVGEIRDLCQAKALAVTNTWPGLAL